MPKKWASSCTGYWDIRPASLKRAKIFLDLDWRSRRDVLNPLTESVFYGHATTQLLNSYSSYNNEIYTVP